MYKWPADGSHCQKSRLEGKLKRMEHISGIAIGIGMGIGMGMGDGDQSKRGVGKDRLDFTAYLEYSTCTLP